MTSVADLFLLAAQEQPNAILADLKTRTVTYAEGERLVRQMAARLGDAGIAPGDRIAVLARNRLEIALLFLGSFMIGAVPVPMNSRLTVGDWAYMVRHSAAKALVIGDGHEDALGDIIRQAGASPEFVFHLDAAMSDSIPFSSLLEGAELGAVRHVDGAQDAYQIYTSGTTSSPKGVVVSHDALRATIHQLGSLHQHAGVLGERLLVVAPMFHSGITVQWLTNLCYGGSLGIHQSFRADDVIAELAGGGVVWTMLMPTMIDLCLRQGRSVTFDGLKLILYGGSSIRAETLRAAQDYFGCGFLQLYGLSETNPITALMPTDHERALAGPAKILESAGKPIPGSEIELRDEAGRRIVDSGVIGEIVSRGPQQMSGYWRDPDRTAQVVREGWIFTKDAGFWDEHGFLHVVGRLDDMIVSGGENIHPDEVEDAIASCAGVSEVAVVGVPDEVWGEAVTAVVVWESEAHRDVSQLAAYCRERLPGFKVPRQFLVRSRSLPRNATGKLQRSKLRSELGGPHEMERYRRDGSADV